MGLRAHFLSEQIEDLGELLSYFANTFPDFAGKPDKFRSKRDVDLLRVDKLARASRRLRLFSWVQPALIAPDTRSPGETPLKLKPINIAIVTALAALASSAALAQQAATSLERVEVTGSRILSANAESPAPIQVLTAADIAASGVTNLQELLLKNPVFGTPTISRTNSNFSTSSAGVATVDLRNLGSDRTLVLVNGRRYVAGISGSSTVDLNTIPTDFIERVEVMTGGASAAYGSDAVAGVVNIVLKKNFKGLMLDAQVGQSQKNDDKIKKFSITGGVSSGDGRDNIMAHFSASQQGAVYSRDRAISAVDELSQFALSGEAADISKVNRPAYSSFAPQGRFFYRGALTPGGAVATRNYTYDSAGKEIPFSTNGPAADGVGATGFNRSAYRTIAIPTDRLLFAANGEKAINDSHSVFFEGTYAATKTKTRLEPFPLDSTGGANPIYQGGGYVPAEFLVGGVMLKNPLVPDYLFSRATDRDGDGARDYNFTRRMADIDVRGNRAERDTFRFLAGVKGEITKTWSYDAYAAYGFTKEAQTSTGQVNVANFRNALEAIPDLNDINNNGSKTDAICRDPIARAQGCVPINVFGAGTISPASAAYVRADGSLITKVTQKFAGGTVSGEPFSLPAGPVGVAFGAEYRKEASLDEADALTQAGLNAGNARPKTIGSFDVSEVFAEVKLPLLKNLMLVKSLDANAAVRSGNYSTVGRVSSWNAGLDWALNSSVRVRANSAVSTRAPNIGELFQGASQTFPTGLVDPCLGVTATSVGEKDTRCRAAPGVNANIAAAADGKFSLNTADAQGVSGFDSGNPQLAAEKGKSNTFGIVFAPKDIDLLRNVTFTADYFDIKIDKAINNPGRQFTLNQCYSIDATYCKDITRRPTQLGAQSAGSLAIINQASANTGGQLTRGVDLTASQAMKLGGGQLSTRLSYTYLIKAYNKPTPDSDINYSQDEPGSSRNRWVLDVGYDWNGFGVKTTATYIGHSYLDDQSFSDTFDAVDDTKVIRTARENRKMFGEVKAKVYLDTQFTYKATKAAQFYFGINNLTGTKPPAIVSGLPGNTTGAETDAGTYDAIGRRYYIGIRYSL